MTHALASRQAAAGEAAGRARRGWMLAALALAAAMIAGLGALVWVGYQGSDDGTYAEAGLAWATGVPQVGQSHWALRYPVVLPLALGFRVFGATETAIGVPMLLYLFGVVAVSAWVLQRWFGRIESGIFILLFCTMPGTIVLSTYANADIPELFYVAASLALYWLAAERNGRGWLLCGAGVCAGLGFLTRETAGGLVLAYGLLFLVRPAVPRARFLLIALGFALAPALQTAYLAWATGDPLYRFALDATHDQVDRAAAAGAGRVLDREGNLALGGVLAPLAVFLVSQKYALAFYLMLGLLPVLRGGGDTPGQRRILAALAALFVAWTGFLVANLSLLYIVARYFVTTAWVATLLAAIALPRLGRRRPALAGTLLAAGLSANAVCLYLENTDPIAASRAAISVTLRAAEPVYSDPLTVRRGRFIADARGASARLRAGLPPPGALYVYAPDNLARCRQAACGFDAAGYQPGPGWVAVERIAPPPRAIAGLLDALHLTPLIPAEIRQKIVQPNAGVIVFRAG